MPGTQNLFGEDPVSAAKSSSGWMTAHCDGGSRGNPGPAGYGAVVVDAEGMVLVELSEFLGFCSNNVAEYRGLLGVLEWVLANGAGRLRVVSDSLLMVNQIKGRFKVGSPDLRPLWEQARRTIAQLAGFEISHALRHKNKDADRLANEAMDRGMGRQRRPGEADAPLRAVAYPAKANEPERPKSFGGATENRGLAAAPTPAATGSALGTTRLAPAAKGSAPAATGIASAATGLAPAATGMMLRGFVRDGAIHLLGEARLPDGVFVKIIPE